MENNQQKISVIVPIYNAEKYLHRCVDSILNQAFTDIEVLLINDGSKDQSPAICDEYAKKDSRVRVFHKENGGVSSARNMGIDKALGEYLLFVDSDDMLNSSFLEKVLLDINKYKPECLCFNGIAVNKDGDITPLRTKVTCNYYSNKQVYINENSFRKEVFLHFFLKNTLDKYNIRFSEGIKYAEDLEFFIKYFSICEGVYSSSIIGYTHYYNPNSAMNKRFTFENVLDHYKIIENIKNFYEHNRDKVDKAFIKDSIYMFVVTSIGFISLQRFYLWFRLELFYKKYYWHFLRKNDFGLQKNIFLLLFFISIIPFVIYFKIKKSLR